MTYIWEWLFHTTFCHPLMKWWAHHKICLSSDKGRTRTEMAKMTGMSSYSEQRRWNTPVEIRNYSNLVQYCQRTMMLGKQLQKLTYIFSLHFLNSWVWEILSQNQMRDSTVHKKGVTPTKLTRDLHIHIYTVYKKPVRSSYQVKATTELSNRTV